MNLHDLRRLGLFAVSFTAGVAVGHLSDRPLWQTIAATSTTFLLCAAALDYVFDPIRAALRRPRPNPDPPPTPPGGRRLDDDRPGWIKDAR